MAEVTASVTAAVINDLTDEIGENIQAKGFREDWDLATKLEEIADEYPEIDLDEAEEILRKAANALRLNVLGTKLMLITSELSEALETLRDHGMDIMSGEGNFGEELADAVIRIADTSHMIKSPLGDEITRKVEVNRERAHKHGRKA